MGVESKKEKMSPTLAVSAGGAEGTEEDKGLLKLKAILMGKKKEGKRKDSAPFVTDKGGKGAPMLARHPTERIMRNQKQQGRKGGSPKLVSIADINPVTAKPYPGPNNLMGLKALAWNSTVVYSILTYRRHQLTKKNPILIPKGKEPPFKLSILDYTANEVVYLPYLRDSEKHALVKIYMKLDPLNVYTRKGKVFRDKKNDVLTKGEIELVDAFEKRHWDFYEKRRNDSKAILDFLHDPDPYYSEESNWQFLLTTILEDLLIIDRGVLIKTRDEEGRLVALTPVDGATIRPIIDENGFITQYAQVVDGHEFVNIYDKNDVVLFRMNLTTDVYRYGYGMPNMEVLSRTVLSDIFIDKGNLDYYRKGGSVPEGFLVVEPPGNTDEGYVQLDKETLDGIQRQLQAIIMSDFTQVPLISGGKFSWISLKGTRKDMQFKELAEYLTRKICAVFQVSPQDVGVIADVNRSTAEAQMSLTRAKGLETLAATISNYFTRGVIDELRPERDIKLWWDEDDAKIAQERWTVTMQQLNTGVKTINEVRAEQGEDPVPWGDTPFQGLKNWISEEEMMEMQQQGQVPGAPLPGGGAQGGAPLPLAGAAGKNPGPQNLGPVPSGQVPGQSLGTPANPANTNKSIADILAEVKEWEEDPELDTTPLVKAFMSPDVDSLDDVLSETGESVVVDMLDVADSVLESIIKDIKIERDNIYFLVTGWLDRNVVTKVLFQLFNNMPETDINILDITSTKAVVTLRDAEVFHYEAFSSPKLRLLAQLLALTSPKALETLTLHFVTAQEDFDSIKGAVQVNEEEALKVVREYAKTLMDRDLSITAYAAILEGVGLTEDVAKNVKYGGPSNVMSFLYAWKADYGLKLSTGAKDFIVDKIKKSGKNDEEYEYYAEYFDKLHSLGNEPLLTWSYFLNAEQYEPDKVNDASLWAYTPGMLYTRLAKIRKELTKDDKNNLLDAVLVSAMDQWKWAENAILAAENDKELRKRLIHTLQLEIPWKVGKKKIEDAILRVAAAYQDWKAILSTASEYLLTGISGWHIVPSEEVNVLSWEEMRDITAPYNTFVRRVTEFTEIRKNVLEDLKYELRRLLIDLAIAEKKHSTALEEVSALISEGLGVESVPLQLTEESVDTLVDMANALSTGNPELDANVIPVVRSLILGEDVDEIQKTLAVALLKEVGSETS